MEKLEEILKEVRPDIDFKNEKNLISDELLTSFDIVSITAEIQSVFGVNLDITDIVPENFESIEAIMKLIESKEK